MKTEKKGKSKLIKNYKKNSKKWRKSVFRTRN